MRKFSTKYVTSEKVRVSLSVGDADNLVIVDFRIGAEACWCMVLAVVRDGALLERCNELYGATLAVQ